MHSWSLVCFTLLTQCGIGLFGIGAVERWLGLNGDSANQLWPLITALALTGAGLATALAHLSAPRLAPHAIRNLKSSWLSWEILLIQAFTGGLALLVFVVIFDMPALLLFVEVATILCAGAALAAMIKVYLLKTVPAWNTAATPLEFLGSTLLLGGSVSVLLHVVQSSIDPRLDVSLVAGSTGIGLGLVLKLLAVSSQSGGRGTGESDMWHAPAEQSLNPFQFLACRTGLFLLGVTMTLATAWPIGPAWMWAIVVLVCFSAAEVLGRARFYSSYNRVGL